MAKNMYKTEDETSSEEPRLDRKSLDNKAFQSLCTSTKETALKMPLTKHHREARNTILSISGGRRTTFIWKIQEWQTSKFQSFLPPLDFPKPMLSGQKMIFKESRTDPLLPMH